ncbi:hypothetical protein GOBAR_AA03692 [Gossypium barbadense]|uniref:DUF8040 domain-containing protein n=1 Tax=Gossypium barbadense TaxID=3634 RepID=A0A2P5YMR2_GOSBA|nr:hypothetical protein GOBAR_AA03692 [Gossypium barbadense]
MQPLSQPNPFLLSLTQPQNPRTATPTTIPPPSLTHAPYIMTTTQGKSKVVIPTSKKWKGPGRLPRPPRSSEFQLGYPTSLNCFLVHQSSAVKFHFNLTAGAETGLKLSAAIKAVDLPPLEVKQAEEVIKLHSLSSVSLCNMYIILGCPELPLTFAYPTPEFPTPNFEYHTAFDGVVFGIEWRLWRKLLKESTGIGWCPSKKTVDATEEWWAKKIQENPDFKGFKKKGIEPRLNDLIWQMFGGIVATGENAWAPSSGVLPSGVPMGDDTPNEGFGDSDENSNENESIPPNEVPSNPPRETSNRRKETLWVVHGKGKKSSSSRKSSRDSLATHIEKLCESMASPRNFYMNYDTPELSEEAQRRIATIVTQVEHNNYHEEEEQVLSSVLLHHETYFTKQPCMDSNYTGQIWVDEVLNGHDGRCMNSFRMPKNIFHSLLHDLQTNYGLKHGNVSAMEKLALSLYILGNRESNSNAAERFQRSGETVSRIFTDMLQIFAQMGIDTIKPTEGQFEEVRNHIRHDTRYWPHFKEWSHLSRPLRDSPRSTLRFTRHIGAVLDTYPSRLDVPSRHLEHDPHEDD